MSPSDNLTRRPQTDITSLDRQLTSTSPNPKLPQQKRFLRGRAGPGIANQAFCRSESQSQPSAGNGPPCCRASGRSTLLLSVFHLGLCGLRGFIPFSKGVWVLKSRHGKNVRAHTHTPKALFLHSFASRCFHDFLKKKNRKTKKTCSYLLFAISLRKEVCSYRLKRKRRITPILKWTNVRRGSSQGREGKHPKRLSS